MFFSSASQTSCYEFRSQQFSLKHSRDRKDVCMKFHSKKKELKTLHVYKREKFLMSEKY